MHFLEILFIRSLFASYNPSKHLKISRATDHIDLATAALNFKKIRFEGRFHEQSYDLY